MSRSTIDLTALKELAALPPRDPSDPAESARRLYASGHSVQFIAHVLHLPPGEVALMLKEP